MATCVLRCVSYALLTCRYRKFNRNSYADLRRGFHRTSPYAPCPIHSSPSYWGGNGSSIRLQHAVYCDNFHQNSDARAAWGAALDAAT